MDQAEKRNKRRKLKRQIDAYFNQDESDNNPCIEDERPDSNDCNDTDSQISSSCVKDGEGGDGEGDDGEEGNTEDGNSKDDIGDFSSGADFGGENSEMDNSFDTDVALSNSDCCSDKEPDNRPFQNKLACWSSKHNLSREAINEMLQLLSGEGFDVPKDSRTLLKTPRSINVDIGANSSYYYIGIKAAVKNLSLHSTTAIKLIINIDGLPLFKSTNSQLWPILGCIFGSNHVFPIAGSLLILTVSQGA